LRGLCHKTKGDWIIEDQPSPENTQAEGQTKPEIETGLLAIAQNLVKKAA